MTATVTFVACGDAFGTGIGCHFDRTFELVAWLIMAFMAASVLAVRIVM